jgi:protein TonB
MERRQSPAFPVFDVGRPASARGGRRWRRNAATVACAVAVHAALLWGLVGRPPGGEGRSSALDLVFVDTLAVPAGMPLVRQGGAPAGGPSLAGDQPSERPADSVPGDGSSPKGQGGRPQAATDTAEAARTAAIPGEAAASQAGAGDPFSDGLLGAAANNAYQQLLLRHIRPFRLYPAEAASRRAEGVVVVRFRVARGGEIEEAWVVRRSRDPALDRAALDTLWRAEPMPAVPDDLPAPVEVELPVPFRLPR